MKEVMVRAWEIAKEAVVKFGGKAIEYIAEALKLAWAEFKNAQIVEVVTHCEETAYALFQFMNTDSNGFDRSARVWAKPRDFFRIYFNLNGWNGYLQLSKETFKITKWDFDVKCYHKTVDEIKRIVEEYNANGVVTA